MRKIEETNNNPHTLLSIHTVVSQVANAAFYQSITFHSKLRDKLSEQELSWNLVLDQSSMLGMHAGGLVEDGQ